MYKYILFDADNTLLDFEFDERNAFFALMDETNQPQNKNAYEFYSTHNLELWKMYEKGEINKQDITRRRFNDLVTDGIISGNGIQLNDRFCLLLSEGGEPVKNAESVCFTLKEKGYRLFIVTNGTEFIQEKRFERSGLKEYFDEVFISDCIGYQKPKKEFFDYVFNKIGDNDLSKYLIVGDSLSSDILGGKNAGIDTCWFNIKKIRNDSQIAPDYTICELSDLIKIL